MKKILPFFFVFVVFSAFGQMGITNSQAAGLANATVALNSPGAIFNNQAALANLPKWIVSANAERRFLLSELQSVSVGAALPTKSGTFGMMVQSFGYEGFKQQKLGLSYGRKLWSALSVGAQFDFFQVRIQEYGSKGAISFEGGIQAMISKNLSIGAHVLSPRQVELAGGENLPTIFRLGVAWKVSEKLLFVSEIEKDLDFKPRWKNGLSYQPVQPLYLRAGFSTEPAMLFFGVGYHLENGLQLDTAGSFHQTLGFSPSAGVTWQ